MIAKEKNSKTWISNAACASVVEIRGTLSCNCEKGKILERFQANSLWLNRIPWEFLDFSESTEFLSRPFPGRRWTRKSPGVGRECRCARAISQISGSATERIEMDVPLQFIIADGTDGALDVAERSTTCRRGQRLTAPSGNRMESICTCRHISYSRKYSSERNMLANRSRECAPLFRLINQSIRGDEAYPAESPLSSSGNVTFQTSLDTFARSLLIFIYAD